MFRASRHTFSRNRCSSAVAPSTVCPSLQCRAAPQQSRERGGAVLPFPSATLGSLSSRFSRGPPFAPARSTLKPPVDLERQGSFAWVGKDSRLDDSSQASMPAYASLGSFCSLSFLSSEPGGGSAEPAFSAAATAAGSAPVCDPATAPAADPSQTAAAESPKSFRERPGGRAGKAQPVQ